MDTIASETIRTAGPTQGRTGRFGKLGLDVGVFGRWSRLLWGVAIILPLAFGAFQDLQRSGSSLWFYGLATAVSVIFAIYPDVIISRPTKP